MLLDRASRAYLMQAMEAFPEVAARVPGRSRA